MSTKSFPILNQKFVSFRSATSNELEEKKDIAEEEEYHEETLSVRDDILAAVNAEPWYKVSERWDEWFLAR